MQKKTLVIGASTNPERYSYQAIKMLKEYGHPVKAVAIKAGEVEGVVFDTEQVAYEGVDTVTLYVGPQHQASYYDYVLSLKPQRVLFNPGTENPEFKKMLADAGINPVEACTLVLLKTDQY